MLFYNQSNKILQLMSGITRTINGSGFCYLGLLAGEPTRDGSSLNEISTADYPSYERILLNAYDAQSLVNVWNAPANGVLTNGKAFSGDSQCLEEDGWPEATHWCVFDAKTGGNPMVADVFRDPEGEIDPTTGLYPQTTLKVEYKKVPVFRKGALQLTLK